MNATQMLHARALAFRIEGAIQASVDEGRCTEEEIHEVLDAAIAGTPIPKSSELISWYLGLFEPSVASAMAANPNIRSMAEEAWRSEIGDKAARALFEKLIELIKPSTPFTYEEFILAAQVS
jgi:hypothetical protein